VPPQTPAEHPPDDLHKGIHTKGFEQKPQRPVAYLWQVLVARISTHEDNRQFRMHSAPALGHGIARPHLGGGQQIDVSNQQLDPLNAPLRFGRFSLLHTGGADDTIALQTQHLHERLTHRLLIVNNENGEL
jgi:hypothetical protein